jgi:hypothetical protein
MTPSMGCKEGKGKRKELGVNSVIPGYPAVTREGHLMAITGLVDAAGRLVICRHDGEPISRSTGGQVTGTARRRVVLIRKNSFDRLGSDD